jgi:outer membrane protein assembly factor BamC
MLKRMNPSQNYRAVLAIALLAVATGCSWFNFGRNDNSNTQVRESLEVPPDLARPAGTDLSAATDARKPVTASSIPAGTAPGSAPATAAAESRVRLERDGAQRWLVVQGDPKQTWAQVRDYYLRNKIKLTTDNVDTGIIETEWMTRPVKADSAVGQFFSWFRSTGMRDRYRVRVEAGRQPGTSEVFVSHQALEEVIASGGGVQVVHTEWQPAGSDPLMEAEMLATLMTQLGLDKKQAESQLLASTSERAQLVKEGLLLSEQDLDNAWRRVGQALDRAAVRTEDRDRTAGIFYVHYSPRGGSEKGSVLTDWLMTDRGPDNKKEGPKESYQVALSSTARGTVIGIRDVAGKPDTGKGAKELLELLYLQLR